MLVNFWWQVGIHTINMVPKQKQCNSQFFGQGVLYGLHANTRSIEMTKTILIHMDNPSPHRSKEMLRYVKGFVFQPEPHPAFSADLMVSDFFCWDNQKKTERMRLSGPR
jgi:hypothetical protein